MRCDRCGQVFQAGDTTMEVRSGEMISRDDDPSLVEFETDEYWEWIHKECYDALEDRGVVETEMSQQVSDLLKETQWKKRLDAQIKKNEEFIAGEIPVKEMYKLKMMAQEIEHLFD